jgi:F-box protein, helicase, 18
VHIPEGLIPESVMESPHVVVINDEEKALTEHLKAKDKQKEAAPKEKAYSVESLRSKHKDAYKPWSAELDQELTAMYGRGCTIQEIAEHFGRTKGSIWSRVRKLELEESYH